MGLCIELPQQVENGLKSPPFGKFSAGSLAKAGHPRSENQDQKPTQAKGGLEWGTVALIYTLTRICFVEYINEMESAFEIIAEPNRRAILSLLASSQQSVGEIERRLRMTQPTVSKHLRVLRESGFVESTVDAQRRLYRLKPKPFQEIDDWLAQFRRFWSAHVDALERYLDRMDDSPASTKSAPMKNKTGRKTRPNRERNK
jgi:DNA-binding transcriptional ArsR family regulator